jgi:topoisomerase-4 subunit A
MTCIGLDGKPVQKPLRQMLEEWIDFRQATITRRSEYRLAKVLDRIHILEGRQAVLLNIDEVIALIRASDEPKPALMERFNLSERQAEDILEIRLRQLARLEAIKIEQELAALRDEQKGLEEILQDSKALRSLMVKEIKADAKEFGDARRTLIQAEKKVVAEVKVVDEPVTVVISEKGWVRTRQGHGHEAAVFTFKSGDQLWGTFECRTVDQLIVFGDNGRVYSVAVSSLPGGRGDGQPVTTMIDLESGSQITAYFAGSADSQLLLASSGGYGFVAKLESMVARNKAGKSFVTVQDGETLCLPSNLAAIPAATADGVDTPAATHVACLSSDGHVLTYALSELKLMSGGRGLQLMKLEDKASLVGAAAYTRSVRITGNGRGGKDREETLELRSLNNAAGKRGSKGKAAGWTFKPSGIFRVE